MSPKLLVVGCWPVRMDRGTVINIFISIDVELENRAAFYVFCDTTALTKTTRGKSERHVADDHSS